MTKTDVVQPAFETLLAESSGDMCSDSQTMDMTILAADKMNRVPSSTLHLCDVERFAFRCAKVSDIRRLTSTFREEHCVVQHDFQKQVFISSSAHYLLLAIVGR